MIYKIEPFSRKIWARFYNPPYFLKITQQGKYISVTNDPTFSSYGTYPLMDMYISPIPLNFGPYYICPTANNDFFLS